jgi:hypothetical protein
MKKTSKLFNFIFINRLFKFLYTRVKRTILKSLISITITKRKNKVTIAHYNYKRNHFNLVKFKNIKKY